VRIYFGFSLFIIVNLLCASAPAQNSDARGVGYNKLKGSNNSEAEVKPLDKMLNSLLNGRNDEIIKNIESKYGCKPLSSEPSLRAAQLIDRFNTVPRSEEEIKYQAFCWESADRTVKGLKNKNPALANLLSTKAQQNRDSIKIQEAIDSCPGGTGDFGSRLKKQLQVAMPFDDIFRSIPIKVPPSVSEELSLSQLRDAIYAESLVQGVESGITVAKTHGLKFSNIVEKVCPEGSACVKDNKLRNLKEFLQSRYENLKNSNIPQKSDLEVYQALSNSVKKMDLNAKTFNSNLQCKIFGQGPESSLSQCYSKNSDSNQKQLNSNYYNHIDDVFGSDEGSLLAHEPFKGQLASMYRGIPVKIDNETHYIAFEKRNESPTKDFGSGKAVWDELPDNLRLVGGQKAVHDAAANALQNTIKYTSELNKIENDIQHGRDPDYGIFTSGNPELKGLALMARLNPGATARVIVSNPQLAKSGVLCKMLTVGEEFEKDKQVEGKIQTVLGFGSIAVGLTAFLLPTGVTQVMSAALTATGVAMAAGGTAISAKNVYDQHLLANRTSAAYSATKNVDLKYDSEIANSEMASSAAQVVGDAAGPFLIKGLTKGISAERLITNKAILDEANSATKSGIYALKSIKDPEIQGAILARMKGPEGLRALDEAAKKNPKEVEKIIDKINNICGKKAASLFNNKTFFPFAMMSQLIVSQAIAADFGCSYAELNELADQLQRFAGFDSATLRRGEWVSVKNSDLTLSNAKVIRVDGDQVIVNVFDAQNHALEKTVNSYELGHPLQAHSPSNKIPLDSWRSQKPGTPVTYQSLRGNTYNGRYVAETKDFIFYKEANGEVAMLKKEKLKDFSYKGSQYKENSNQNSNFMAGDQITFMRHSGELWRGKIEMIYPDGSAQVSFINEAGLPAHRKINLEDLIGEMKKTPPPVPPRAPPASPPAPLNQAKSPFPPRKQSPDQVLKFKKEEAAFPASKLSRAEQQAFFDDASTFKDYGGSKEASRLKEKGFKVFGIERGANVSNAELKTTYLKLIRKYHPDNAKDYAAEMGLDPSEAKAILTEQLSLINTTYDVLKKTISY
jgi:hypothetical protein